jgi:hypothetical protein
MTSRCGLSTACRRAQEISRGSVVGATAVLCVLLFGAGGGPAEAAFPGRNGGIAFDSDLAVPGEQLDIFTVSPKGGSPVNLRTIRPSISSRAGRRTVARSPSRAIGTAISRSL